MTLLWALERIAPERSAIVTEAGTMTYAELAAGGRALAPTLSGARIILNIADLAGGARLLAGADGAAEAIALIAPGADPEILARLIGQLSPDIVVSDQSEALAGCAQQVTAAPDTIKDLAKGCPPERTRWIMTTSGTTSAPKLVAHDLTSLTRTARTDTERGCGQVWGMIYDYTRFAGLQVLLQSLLSGATLVQPPLKARVDEKIRFLAEAGCTHLSATPTMWRKILMSGDAAMLALRQVTMGGEIADDRILGSLAKIYPEARVTHIYASTEAGVGFSVTDGRAGFPVAFLDTSPAGIALAVRDDRLWIKNEQVGAEYLGGGGKLLQDGWVDTGDLVTRQGDRYIFRGRESGVINVGGNKVHPEEVERAILSHPHILMARVYARANPLMGALVAADIVLDAAAPNTTCSDLQAFLRERLEKHMVPAILKVTQPFDVTPAGKIRRQS